MNKAELVEVLAKRHFNGNRAEANRVLNAVVEVITAEAAATGKVSIAGFGVFEKMHRDARTVRNPKTGARKDVDAMDYVKFRPGTTLSSMVAGDLPLPEWVSGGR